VTPWDRLCAGADTARARFRARRPDAVRFAARRTDARARNLRGLKPRPAAAFGKTRPGPTSSWHMTSAQHDVPRA